MQDVPDLGALELFVSAVRHRSISAAARESGVAQQTASVRLRGLERMLGLELLRRSPQGVVPTAAGEVAAARADDLIAGAERFRVAIETLRDEHRRDLTVAASQTVAEHLLPRWLVALRERQMRAGRSPTAVRMVTANSVEVEEFVRAGVVDLGFIESPALPEGLSHTVVTTDELTLVVAPSHPWVARDGVALADVAAQGVLVMREEGSGTRRAWEETVKSRVGGMPVVPLAVLATSASVRSAVSGGLGAAILSNFAITDDLRLGRLVEVPLIEGVVTRPITALWRGGRRDLSITSRELIETAVECELGPAE